MRDFRISSVSNGDQITEEEKLIWKRLCQSYLFGQQEVARYKRPKEHRVAAYDFGTALDNALRSTQGPGLVKFQRAVDTPPTRHDPCLTIALDQGSIGVSWIGFGMNRLKLNRLPLWDPSHRLWNDTKMAISSVGSWRFILVHTVLLNLFH